MFDFTGTALVIIYVGLESMEKKPTRYIYVDLKLVVQPLSESDSTKVEVD